MSDNRPHNDPWRVITNNQIAEIFARPIILKDSDSVKANKWLCGIFPINRNVFSFDDYLPSSLTDQPKPMDNTSQSLSHCDNPTTITNNIASTSCEIVTLTEQMSSGQNLAVVTDQAECSFRRPNGGELIEAVITPVTECTVKKWTFPVEVIPLPKRQQSQKGKSKSKSWQF